MCGIAGIVGSGDATVVEAMVEALHHRGPDGGAVWTDPEARVAMGHRRLAIIDLSEAGQQPMSDASGRYVVTFNGELYNYRALRLELEQAGETFRTHTDTEVLLVAWQRWGLDCLDRLRGMFAFAIWDRHTRTLHAARDRFGIKPLYFAERDGGLVFASELRALLASGLVERRADPTALVDYLRYGAFRQPRTLLAGVHALLPGHWLRWQDGRLTQGAWWDLETRTRSLRKALHGISRADATAELRRLLEDAARHHLVGDVEVGGFLSGGIDSTAVVGLMTLASGRPVRTFAVGFTGQHARLSELEFARVAARRHGSIHTEVVIEDADVERAAEALTRDIDQPSIDGTNTWFVSRAVAGELRVALSGLGADELFGGYSHFRRIGLSARLAPGGWTALSGLTKRLPARLRVPLETLQADEIERLAALRRLLDDEAIASLAPTIAAAGEDARAQVARLLHPDLDTAAQVSAFEVSTYLRDTLLRDGDALSMAHSLEVRPLLLDHPLAEFAFALPSRLKHSLTRGKTIFVDSVRDLLPDEVVNRPKRGFELPLGDWLRGPLRERAMAAFMGAAADELLSRQGRAGLVDALSSQGPTPRHAWSLFMLLQYLDHHGISVDAADARRVA